MTAPPATPSERDGATTPQRRWLARAWDRIPTGWFSGILLAVFLGATAAFGGLADVPAAAVPELAVGDTHDNGPFALTVERSVLIDDLPEAGISVEAGERVLAVVVTAENLWDRPLPSDAPAGVSGSVRIVQLGDTPAQAVARFDDTTTAPILQPRVPAQLVLTWAVPADEFEEGERLDVELRDFTQVAGRLIVDGEWWDDPVTAAQLSLPVTDVGAGADAESDEAAAG